MPQGECGSLQRQCYCGEVSTRGDAQPDRAQRDPAHPLRGARVVVGVTGGIAAYKAAEVVRLLDKAGAVVHVAMTQSAQEFVTAMTFQALTRRPVFVDLFSLTDEQAIGHIELADRADVVVIAPATANCIARLAAGMADDPVLAIALATRAPVLVAPSMNVNMWTHALTQRNLKALEELAGYRVVAPGEGYLACGWTGPGRLAEPADIVEAAAHAVADKDLADVRVVVTAGPTYEAIDPVRFVGNRSSGKMGVAIAAAARRRGAKVQLILGPSAVAPPAGVATTQVESTAQLERALAVAADGADIVVMTAAVADFRPTHLGEHKRKRSAVGSKWQLDLVANPDLLAKLGRERTGAAPLLVGFAAETDNVIANAQAKLAAKRCDLIVANNVAEPGSGFAVDSNHIIFVDADGVTDVPPGTKVDLAHRIWDKVIALRSARLGPARPGPGKTTGKPRVSRLKSRRSAKRR